MNRLLKPAEHGQLRSSECNFSAPSERCRWLWADTIHPRMPWDVKLNRTATPRAHGGAVPSFSHLLLLQEPSALGMVGWEGRGECWDGDRGSSDTTLQCHRLLLLLLLLLGPWRIHENWQWGQGDNLKELKQLETWREKWQVLLHFLKLNLVYFWGQMVRRTDAHQGLRWKFQESKRTWGMSSRGNRGRDNFGSEINATGIFPLI